MDRFGALELQRRILERGLNRVRPHEIELWGRGGGAAEAEAMPPLQAADLAVGITGKGDSFALAVRSSRDGEDVRAAVAAIREEAPVDFRVVGHILALSKPWYQSKISPLWPGCSAAHRRVSLGTLGCFVSRRNDPNRWPHILSNNHVLAREREDLEPRPKDWVFQPADGDDDDQEDDTVAQLTHWVPLMKEDNVVDAAIAHLQQGVAWEPKVLAGLGDIQGVRPLSEPLRNGEAVHKVGRTTGLRTGRIASEHLKPVPVQFGTGMRSFVEVLEVDSEEPDLFCDHGDSGSLIVDEQLRAVGLLFAKADAAGTAYANPIHRVLDMLDVDLLLEVTN
jgi:hypothetical protein